MSGCARKTLCYRALRLPPGVPDLDRTGVTTTSRAWVFHHCGKVLWIRHGGSVLRTRSSASLGACPGARSCRPSRDHDRHVVRRRPRGRAHRPGPVARGAQPVGQRTPAAQSSSPDRGGRGGSRRSPGQDRTRGERSPAVERRRPDRSAGHRPRGSPSRGLRRGRCTATGRHDPGAGARSCARRPGTAVPQLHVRRVRARTQQPVRARRGDGGGRGAARPRPTTRCSSTAAWAWARPTC